MQTVRIETRDSSLATIRDKIVAGERLTQADGEALYASSDILSIGKMADLVKRRKVGDDVYFIVNRHINHTNVCNNRCKFCAFSRDKDEKDAYTMNLDQVFEAAKSAKPLGISELHIVGGLHPDLPWSYYLEMMRGLKKIMPEVHIQAFTAVEIDHFSKISGLPVDEVLAELKEAGLGSLPGGGAEIFSERAREAAWEKKIPGERWLDIMRTAHGLGIRSNATMLYGHIETIGERVDHLIRLRELQDETGGFAAFIPLAFHPANTEMSSLASTTGFDDLKTLAIARLMLDNFDHIKAFWIMVGPKVAQVSLAFGVDDVDGTVVEEKITHFAGAETPEFIDKKELVRLVRETGNTPVERDTLYNVIRRYE
ncbi:MAG: aminofutalosine synthase MqnE [Actinobacteria bacterium]|nr:MAG: aminofutalosine synthase MqnE [Actinomycetota bacterium]